MDTKTRPLYVLFTRDPPQNKGHIQTESEGLEKIFHTNGDQKKAGVAILISDKIDFEIKAVKRDKKGHYIMIKGSIQEEDITIINIYSPNIGEGDGTPFQYSCLENPMGGGARKAAVHGVGKSRIRLSNFTFTRWRRKWQPTPAFLLGESQGRGSLVGCRLWGRTESGTTEATWQQQQQTYICFSMSDSSLPGFLVSAYVF